MKSGEIFITSNVIFTEHLLFNAIFHAVEEDDEGRIVVWQFVQKKVYVFLEYKDYLVHLSVMYTFHVKEK